MAHRLLGCAQRLRETVCTPQVWDINGPASKEIGGEYHCVLAGNVLHNAADLAGEPTSATSQFWLVRSAHMLSPKILIANSVLHMSDIARGAVLQ